MIHGILSAITTIILLSIGIVFFNYESNMAINCILYFVISIDLRERLR